MARTCPQCGASFGIREAKCSYCGYVDAEYEQHREKESEQKIRYLNALAEREKIQTDFEKERLDSERDTAAKRAKESGERRKVFWIGFAFFVLLNMFPIIYGILILMFEMGS